MTDSRFKLFWWNKRCLFYWCICCLCYYIGRYYALVLFLCFSITSCINLIQFALHVFSVFMSLKHLGNLFLKSAIQTKFIINTTTTKLTMYWCGQTKLRDVLIADVISCHFLPSEGGSNTHLLHFRIDILQHVSPNIRRDHPPDGKGNFHVRKVNWSLSFPPDAAAELATGPASHRRCI